MDKPKMSLHNLATWHVRSVERSRHNALVATTALVGLRRERDDAEEFMQQHLAARSARQDTHPAAPDVG